MSSVLVSAILRAAVAATAAALLAGCANRSASVEAPALRTVERVDLARYVGTWHEIARYPFAIQDRRCARDTTATYRALTPTKISVVNRCRQADGNEAVAEGVAWVRDPSTNTRLEVSFLPAWLRWLPFGRGDYWIIDLAPDYSWVVVGEPSRRFLWILARTPDLPAATLEAIVARLPAQGYEPARLLRSPGR